MKFRWLSLLLLVPWLSISAPQLKDNYPQEYIVRKGDTLWDIAGRFLTQPWRWPEIWQKNQQIADPHWIFPGDRLYLHWVNGKPVLSKDPHVGSGAAYGVSPIPTLDVGRLLTYLNQEQIADQQALKEWPKVIGNNDGQRRMTGGRPLYVDGLLVSGERYAVFRPQETIRDSNRQTLGVRMSRVTTIEVSESGPVSTALVVGDPLLEIAPGDVVVPELQSDSYSLRMGLQPSSAIKGEILDTSSGSNWMVPRDVVTLNIGKTQGVRQGDVFLVKAPGLETVKTREGRKLAQDATTGQRWLDRNNERLPGEWVGQVVVFQVTDKLSLGLLMSLQEPTRLGAQVISPRYADSLHHASAG